MLQALLEDRFRLALHEESRPFPAYALVVAKSGARIQNSREGSCAKAVSDRPISGASSSKDPPVCGAMAASPRSLNGSGISMEQLAAALSTTMQRTVIDQTGLSGLFDVHLQWTADQSTPGFLAPGLGPAPVSGPASDADDGSIFTVIREQLGLRLQATRAPARVLVIENAEKPSPF